MKKILICINISLLVVIFTGILFMFLSKSPTAEDIFKKNQNRLFFCLIDIERRMIR